MPSSTGLRYFGILCALALPILVGCGSHAQKPARPVGTTPYVAAEHKGGVRGVVTWEGAAPPEPAVIDFSKDPKVAAIDKLVLTNESLVVQNAKAKNAVVFLSSGTEKWIFPPASESVRVEIKNARYEPHAVTVDAGQKLVFANGDEFYHTVLGSPRRVNVEFNEGLHKIGDTVTRTFEYPEMGYKVSSDIRKWMSCYVSVFYHPFHAATKQDGTFELKNVPDGEYTLELWHENPDVQLPSPVKVQVKGGIVEQSLALKMKVKL